MVSGYFQFGNQHIHASTVNSTFTLPDTTTVAHFISTPKGLLFWRELNSKPYAQIGPHLNLAERQVNETIIGSSTRRGQKRPARESSSQVECNIAKMKRTARLMRGKLSFERLVGMSLSLTAKAQSWCTSSTSIIDPAFLMWF